MPGREHENIVNTTAWSGTRKPEGEEGKTQVHCMATMETTRFCVAAFIFAGMCRGEQNERQAESEGEERKREEREGELAAARGGGSKVA